MKFLLVLLAISSIAYSQNQKKQTLIERQSSASCSACANAHKQFQPYIENFEDDVVIVTYQRHDNNHFDPMGIFAIEYVDKRMKEYYNNSSFPTAFVNGGDRQFLLSLTDFQPQEEMSMVNLEVDGVINNGEATIDIDLENWNNTGAIEATNTRAFAIIKEKTVEYSTSPGSNGEKVFHDVMRYMFGNANGFMLDWIDGKASLNLKQEIDFNVVTGDIHAVVFLQNVETKEVYQAQEVMLQITTNAEEESNSGFSVYPNPALDFLKIDNAVSNIEYEIYNNMGMQVLNGNYTNGIDIRELSSGVYFVKINGQLKKFIKG